MKCILAIDVSSSKVKAALISIEGKILFESTKIDGVLDDGHDGFAKILDTGEIWRKIVFCIKEVIGNVKKKDFEIIAFTSCAQRIATVFIDRNGETIYAGPNSDTRGVDYQWIIDDTYENEKDLFEITARNPPLIFALARILWFREEDEEKFKKIHKVLGLDDWIIFKLTGKIVTDVAVASDLFCLDIKKRAWSEEIIKKFDLNSSFFPPIIDIGTVVSSINEELVELFEISKNVPVIKSGADTQIGLIGMGCIEDDQIGITLGSSTPVNLVLSKSKIDPKLNIWTNCHSIQNKWVMEANAGFTGKLYDWYKENFLEGLSNNLDQLIESYLKETTPGANSTITFLGPELMNFANQTQIKRSHIIFPAQGTISGIKTGRKNFARALVENICYGILENYLALQKFQNDKNSKRIHKIFCAGGMANSFEFLKILANVLNHDIFIPVTRSSTYLGQLIVCLVALKIFPDYRTAINKIIKYDQISSDPEISQIYSKLYSRWKILKTKIDKL